MQINLRKKELLIDANFLSMPWMLKVFEIRSLQFVGDGKALNDTLDLAGSGQEV